ncbi:hypothetical protein [Prevotella koreensis]
MTPPRFDYFFSRTKYSLIAPLGSARRRFRSKAKKERSSPNVHRPTFIAQRSSLNAHPSSLITQRSTLNAQRSTLRSTPPGDAFEAKRRKNVHRSTTYSFLHQLVSPDR